MDDSVCTGHYIPKHYTESRYLAVTTGAHEPARSFHGMTDLDRYMLGHELTRVEIFLTPERATLVAHFTDGAFGAEDHPAFLHGCPTCVVEGMLTDFLALPGARLTAHTVNGEPAPLTLPLTAASPAGATFDTASREGIAIVDLHRATAAQPGGPPSDADTVRTLRRWFTALGLGTPA
jgi:hypothetical protein